MEEYRYLVDLNTEQQNKLNQIKLDTFDLDKKENLLKKTIKQKKDELSKLSSDYGNIIETYNRIIVDLIDK